jgi:hypothetical protein
MVVYLWAVVSPGACQNTVIVTWLLGGVVVVIDAIATIGGLPCDPGKVPSTVPLAGAVCVPEVEADPPHAQA